MHVRFLFKQLQLNINHVIPEISIKFSSSGFISLHSF